jgi:hypothetical protein
MAEKSDRDKASPTRFPKQFLRAIFGYDLLKRGLELEIRCIPTDSNRPVIRRFYKSVSKFRKAWKEILGLARQRYNIYLAVLPRDPENEHKLPENLVLSCLWVDIDAGPDKSHKSVSHVLSFLREFEIKPTIVVKSGHGIHVYWCLEGSRTVDVQRAKRLLRSLAKATGGDLQSAEPARLLRLPGTLNWKDKRHPKRCHVVRLKNGRRYRLADIEKRLGMELEKPRRENQKHSGNYLDFFSKHIKRLRKTSDTQAIGRCPFHDDSTPSWSLRTTDGIWHCFGCNASGTAVSFCLLRHIDLTECPGDTALHKHGAVALEGGGYVAWKRTKDDWEKINLTNFAIDWNLENRVSDKIRHEDRVFKGQVITKTDRKISINVSNNELCSNQSFYASLIRECGSRIWLNERYVSLIREASLLFSQAKISKTTMDFGFQDSLAILTFLTPSLRITRKGIRKAKASLIDLSSIEHARHLDLKRIDKKRRKELIHHLCLDLLELQPHSITYPLLGLVGGAPLMHFIDDKTRYALWIVGPSGSGKSFIGKLFQSFFGDFMAEGRVASWSSTVNSLQYLGYFFKDCVFLLDDYKPAMVRNEGSVVQFLQTYADFYARSRLTSEIKSRKDYFVRGLLLTTGEDVPSGHASVVARSLILSVTKQKPDLACGKRCLENCSDYPAFTARYIRFLLRRKNLRRHILADLKAGHELFLSGIEREENAVRVARNLALNSVGFTWITQFLKASKAPFDVSAAREEHTGYLFQLRTQMLGLISEEQPAEVLIGALSEALQNETCQIRTLTSSTNVRGKSVVGFRNSTESKYIYIFPPEAIAAVRIQLQRLGKDFDWTPNAISKALYAKGLLIRPTGSEDSAVRKRVKGKVYRVWQLREDCLGISGEEYADD